MSERTMVSDWPEVKANVNPDTYERMNAEIARTGLSRADLVRQALESAYGSDWQPRPEPYPAGANLRPPGFLS